MEKNAVVDLRRVMRITARNELGESIPSQNVWFTRSVLASRPWFSVADKFDPTDRPNCCEYSVRYADGIPATTTEQEAEPTTQQQARTTSIHVSPIHSIELTRSSQDLADHTPAVLTIPVQGSTVGSELTSTPGKPEETVVMDLATTRLTDGATDTALPSKGKTT